ncbi:MAG: YggS family pyridoxal phosphate-dependent enzyme [Rickettsiales bacterium]|nr:YggS family pyridoxal phosphate-dependent enzyme [Pseudomonadota bacterium]MDA0965731.1 YggS family pyridoxal phosphate-dependent enzyme [Pseudomonadota bacterium]MDG4543807.1 YggS family pyridoxal phosphate-dependent enzyme [Rickettsiales bacterium]MDG4545954.1 YggS family pyridoxal phosphate-dependent enzyme [Rickettsiales bacterium]MDG4548200.1 YggS family pyridoxal phosphate-dependent enzyme [Rickettsiales bacterium]
MIHIKRNLLKISYQINERAKLIAVSKYRSADETLQAIEAGHKIFGENKVQEAVQKWSEIRKKHSDVELHLIGALQTNKVKEAIKTFDVIEVVDREKLANALITEMKKQSKYPDCLIQVNTGEEPQKAGVLPKDADMFIKDCIEKGLPVKGLMCIPPVNEDPKPHFKMLRDLCNKHNLDICSMGMSGDYMQAIDCGATHVRIGTAIFGERAE